MIRRLCVAVALVAVACPAATADEPFGWADVATMVPGTARAAGGQWAYTDYVYDAPDPSDLAILQIAADTDTVRYLVRLNTMLEPDRTVVALAVDTDCDDGTGGGAWPHGAGVSTSGWEHVVTSWGTGATAANEDVASTADTAANTIEIAVPRAIADPGTGAWCYRAAAGAWDPDAGSWTGGIANLLFRNRTFDGGTDATDENASPDFQNEKQAAALASGDLGPFVRRVDFGVLASGATVAPPAVTDDHNFTRIYETSPNTLPEGVTRNGATGFLYNGRYQPYMLFVPASYWSGLPQQAPMVPMLHGWLGDHRGFNPSGNAYWTDVVRANRAIVAKPLGAGEEIWYEHAGEADVLDVIADVRARYAVDADRIYLAGTSMGGLGTIKIATSHPDVFAGIFPSVPPMSDRAQGYVLPANNDWDLAQLAGSLRNVPVRNFTGTYDALVPAGVDSGRFCDALRAAVYDHDCWRDISTGGTHRGYENDRAAEIARLFAEHPRRVIDPAHVTYVSHPVFRRQAAEAGLTDRLRYDRVYWVSGIRYPDPPVDGGCSTTNCVSNPSVPTWPTDPGTVRRLTSGEQLSTIDVRTSGRGDGDPVASEIADDPSPTLVRSGLVLSPGDAAETRNAFTLTTANVLGLDLDLARMGLGLDAPLVGSVSGAGAFELGLVGPGEGCVATLDGAGVPAHRDGARLVMTLELGPSVSTLAVACA